MLYPVHEKYVRIFLKEPCLPAVSYVCITLEFLDGHICRPVPFALPHICELSAA